MTKRLRKFVKGPEFQRDEKTGASSNVARDHGFELTVAAYLAASGIEPDFGSEADLAVEISSDFVAVLRREFSDPRLVIYEGSSTDLEKALAEAGEERADLVVSGVPFSTMERGAGRRTLEAAKRVLSRRGRFVAYQFRSHVRRFAEPVFGPAETHSGFWNLPPMRIYVFKREPLGP